MPPQKNSARLDPSITAQVIAEVEKHPILYNPSLPGFRDSHQKNIAWTQIAKKVGAKSGDFISWKWKHLRDSYSRYQKHIYSPPVDESGRKIGLVNWRWAPNMVFMDPFMRKPKGYFKPDPEDSDESQDDSETAKETIEILEEDMNDSNFYTISTSIQDNNSKSRSSNSVNVSKPKKKRKYLDTMEDITVEPYQEELTSHRLDIVDYLFLNYADTFKKLGRKQQTMLKLNMAKLFAAAELEELGAEDPDPIELKFTVDND